MPDVGRLLRKQSVVCTSKLESLVYKSTLSHIDVTESIGEQRWIFYAQKEEEVGGMADLSQQSETYAFRSAACVGCLYLCVRAPCNKNVVRLDLAFIG
ncbi:hypothetical protein D3C85_1491210 [compost metagenome]